MVSTWRLGVLAANPARMNPHEMTQSPKILLSNPDVADGRVLLADVLRSVLELLLLPGNDFAWSSWSDQAAATTEIESLLSLIEAGEVPDRKVVSVLFAVTGPIQEVSLSSGWADTFLKVAERYDRAEQMLW